MTKFPLPTASRSAHHRSSGPPPWQALRQLFLARMREYVREPAVIFWTYGFPLFLAVGLGIAFADGPSDLPVVDIQASPDAPDAGANGLVAYLRRSGLVVRVCPAEEARHDLRVGRARLVLVPKGTGYEFVYDPTTPDALRTRYQVDAELQRWRAGPSARRPEEQAVNEPGSRYIDYLIPGLIGLNLFGGGLWGVGYVIVDMRMRRLLKRVRATPMRRSDFLLSVVGSRLVFMGPEVLVLILLGVLGFGMPIRGSLLAVLAVILVGGTAFAALGLLVAARPGNSETVAGLINLIMIPMWMFSGTFFSTQRFPAAVQPLIRALPLTQANEALRGLMLDGSSLWQVAPQVLVLAVWGAVAFVLALRYFCWQ